MTLAKKLRDDLVGLTPLFAVVGATDLAAHKLRELGTPEGEFDPDAEPNLRISGAAARPASRPPIGPSPTARPKAVLDSPMECTISG